MATLTPQDYDALERAIRLGQRIAVLRHGRELVVLPVRLFARAGGEALEARHPSTGDSVVFGLADIEGIEVVAW
ncbi:MAG: hypothetical protein ABI877_07505 [Gemmatimonadaceae bacterium]